MSRIFALVAVAMLIAACGSKFDDKPPGSEKNVKISGALTEEEAMKLAARGNCVSCHKIDAMLVGPAWKDVGIKYEHDANAAATIASHIKGGGSFGWKLGSMPVRGGGTLSDAEIDRLAKFIASLR